MIACRSLFRVDRVGKFSSAVDYFLQGHCHYHGLRYNRKMSGAKGMQGAIDQNKKRRTVNRVWRPVCTQASSYEECFEKDVKVECESQHEVLVDKLEEGSQSQEVHYNTSSCVSNVQCVNEDAEAVNEIADSVTSSRALQDKDENKAIEEEPILSDLKHSISVEVGASLMRFIKGKGGSTQKNIEEEMGVTIIFPSSKKEDSIVIEGDSIEGINRASEKIQVIIDEVVKSPNLDYSHFISLPLAIYPELVDKLVSFQNSILGNPCKDENLDSESNEETSDDEDQQLDRQLDVAVELKVEDDSKHVKVDITNIPLRSYPPKTSKPSAPSELGIEKSIFIKPKTFHLTVLMLKLWNKERVDAAAKVLQNISSKVMEALDDRPVSIRLKGLDCMRGSLSKARVLYAPVVEIGSEDRLLLACQVIIDAYVEAGLVLDKDRGQKLKLHATVMNARHKKRKKKTRKSDSFDARGIFKQYGSEEWGDYIIREAHLSQRFVFDENGYYHCCASIPFPENMQVD